MKMVQTANGIEVFTRFDGGVEAAGVVAAHIFGSNKRRKAARRVRKVKLN